jgi:hypothetical protein
MTRKPIVDSYVRQLDFLDPRKPVKVYRNLHTGLWSVKQGVVRFHTKCIFLTEVDFLVNEKNRQRVIREEKKNVHAYVQGFICDRPTYFAVGENWTIAGCHEVTYNPYKNKHFVCRRGEVISAEVCGMIKRDDGRMRVYASNILLTSWDTAGIIDSVPVHLL